jgi:hypothetical protein
MIVLSTGMQVYDRISRIDARWIVVQIDNGLYDPANVILGHGSACHEGD